MVHSSFDVAHWELAIGHWPFPDRLGKPADVVLGFDHLAQYEDPKQNPFFGAMVGRVAFRTTRGEFTLDGKTYRFSREESGRPY